MLWPTIIVDNFFDEPEKIIETSKKFVFRQNLLGKWPGERTDDISSLNYDMFNWITYKIIRLIYPMNHAQIKWNASQYFQKINGNIYQEGGWVHSDTPAELTAIIYLSKHKNCGTSIFDKKTFFNGALYTEKKHNSYLTKNSKENLKYLIKNNNNFEKTITINSKFNRLLIFDANQFHAADSFKDKNYEDEDRSTLITFFHSLNSENIKYPIPEMKRHF
jgi:hypothetical protein